MLNENIKAARKSKGFSQEELAVRLNVVRQTISKWEQGLSVPDSEMLLSLSKVLETPVSILLGETVAEAEYPEYDLKTVSEKLEAINLWFAHRKAVQRKLLVWFFIALCFGLIIVFAIIMKSGSPYLNWDISDSETAVMETAVHAFEWLFVRISPVIFIGAIAGIILVKMKKRTK